MSFRVKNGKIACIVWDAVLTLRIFFHKRYCIWNFKNFSRELRDRKLLHPQMGLCYLTVWLLPMDVVTTMFLIMNFLNVFGTKRHLCHLLSHFFSSAILSVWHFLSSVIFCWAMAYCTLVDVSERSLGAEPFTLQVASTEMRRKDARSSLVMPLSMTFYLEEYSKKGYMNMYPIPMKHYKTILKLKTYKILTCVSNRVFTV